MSHTVLKLMEINISVLGIARWGRSLLIGPNDIYKFKALLPEDYCLIPGNDAIKLVDLD